MRVKINRSMAGIGFSYRTGQVVDLKESTALSYIGAGYATMVEDRENATLDPAAEYRNDKPTAPAREEIEQPKAAKPKK